MNDTIAKARNRGGWTTEARARVDRINAVLTALREYWPLTLRQVYYQLVAALVIPNNLQEYKKLSRMLAKARLDGLSPWEAIEDRARSTLVSGGWADELTFVEDELDRFLDGYRRDLLQSQPVALEVWVEKDALSRVCHGAAFPYCVPVIVARGFSSVTYVNECRNRITRNAARGKPTVVLYFGDLDPSGWAMLPAMLTTLQSEMRLGSAVEGDRCALTPPQVELYRLPRSIDAMKKSDSRTPKFKTMLRREGYPEDMAVELDALPPAALEGLVRDAIERHLDLSQLELEQVREAADRNRLEELRGRVHAFVRGELG